MTFSVWSPRLARGLPLFSSDIGGTLASGGGKTEHTERHKCPGPDGQWFLL